MQRNKIQNKVIAFKVASDFDKKLEKFSEKETISKSAFIRRAILAEFSRATDKKSSKVNSSWIRQSA